MSQHRILPPGMGSHPLCPLWAQHLLVLWACPSVQGAGPLAQNVQMPEAQRESLHQAQKQESDFSTPSTQGRELSREFAFKNTPKQTTLPSSAKPGQFQNMSLKSTILQKCRSRLLSSSSHSSAPGISYESAHLSPCSDHVSRTAFTSAISSPVCLCAWPGRFPQHCHLCFDLLCRRVLRMFPMDLQTYRLTYRQPWVPWCSPI